MSRHSPVSVKTAALVVGTAFVVGFSPGRDPERAANIATMLASTVTVRTVSHVTIDRFGDSVWESGSGSGFLVDARTCEVWTNQHVIAGAALVEVYPHGRTHEAGIPGEVINATPRTDVAIVRMAHCDGLKAARLGNSDLLRPGDETYAVGNPLGENPGSITRGIVSHVERFVRGGDTAYLQTDAAITQGNSGGALYDRHGRVIGINTAVAASSELGNSGIGYALPIAAAMRAVARLRDGPPRWGDAGLARISSLLRPDEAAVFGVPDGLAGMVVIETPTDGPSVGKLEARDVIFRIAGVGVTDATRLGRAIQNLDPGSTVPFDLIRTGEARSVEITLDNGAQDATTPPPDHYTGHLGMALEMWSGREGDVGQFTTPIIANVASLGPAHRARISSSQRTMGMEGPFVVPYQIDVKTITGVVLGGVYHEVDSVEAVEALAAIGHAQSKPLLLEIAHWARRNPMNPRAELEHAQTSFFKVTPRETLGTLAASGPAGTPHADSPHPSAELGGPIEPTALLGAKSL